METRENKIQSSEKLCTGKRSSSVLFDQYFQLFDIHVVRDDFFSEQIQNRHIEEVCETMKVISVQSFVTRKFWWIPS